MVSCAFIISPYPTFEIKVDENLGISMDTVDTKRKPLSHLNADIFRSILNSMARNRKPVERETFVLPLQIIYDNNHIGFENTLFQVLNSYHVLKEIYVPFENALLVINVTGGMFFYYSHGNFDHNLKQ